MISLYVEAWWQLIKFDVLLLCRDFGTLYYTVRNHSLREGDLPRPETAQIIAAFELVCIWYPKLVRCLQRSAALTCLLRNHSVDASLVIGTQKFPFKAHAWVEVNDRVVCDKEYTSEMYAVLDRC